MGAALGTPPIPTPVLLQPSSLSSLSLVRTRKRESSLGYCRAGEIVQVQGSMLTLHIANLDDIQHPQRSPSTTRSDPEFGSKSKP